MADHRCVFVVCLCLSFGAKETHTIVYCASSQGPSLSLVMDPMTAPLYLDEIEHVVLALANDNIVAPGSRFGAKAVGVCRGVSAVSWWHGG